MRLTRTLRMIVLGALLAGCAAPLLLMPTPSQLMWALLKPLVGFDPNAVGLFEQPIVKERMTALLGARYDSVMQLLETADKLEQEGPLFFVVSRYTPLPDLADKAGLVWNSETNQMAAAILEGRAVEVFSEAVERTVDETVEGAVAQIVPTWPGVMQAWVAQ